VVMLKLLICKKTGRFKLNDKKFTCLFQNLSSKHVAAGFLE